MKRLTKKKIKKVSLKQLKKQLWKVFSLFIRQRDNYTCFTCGKVIEEKHKAHCGHFIDAGISKLPLYFSEVNNNCQCISCNNFKSGNKAVYSYKLIQKYGDGIIQQLHELNAKPITKWTAEEYNKLINYYNFKIKEK